MIKLEATIPKLKYWAHINIAHHIPIHWHQYYEIELIAEGTGTQIINSIEVPLRPGSITVISPEDFHRLEPDTPSGFKVVNFCVVPEVLSEEILSLFRKYSPPYIMTADEAQMAEFISDHADLQHTSAKEGELTDAVMRRKIELMLLKLIQRAVQTGSLNTQKQLAPHPSNVLQPVLRYINGHYHESLRRDQLAELVHLSPSYFGDIFKKNLGLSVVDYITDVRLRKAHALLTHTDEPIQNIIRNVGFNSPSLFYRKFYEYYRVKPSDVAKKR
ncbi:MAG: AraC family transcriptional regulator [Clostridia bacterium]|nr:AraC family transcriptional regulator [Clostridia bacterium]